VLQDYVKGLMEKEEENFEDEEENNVKAFQDDKENFDDENSDEDADQGNCKLLINYNSKKKKDSTVVGEVFSVPMKDKKIKMESSTTKSDFFSAKRKLQNDRGEITVDGKKYKLMSLIDN